MVERRPASATWRPAIPALVQGLESIAAHYRAFIVDLWGVLHNGLRAHPGALDCLRLLRAQGKRVCLLSNAPRRVAVVQQRLKSFGIEPSDYDFLMTSGEATWQSLLHPPDSWHARLHPPAFALGPDGDQTIDPSWLTSKRDRARFILAVGPWKASDKVSDCEQQLRWFRARRLPMLCANPDLEVVFGERVMICAGKLAQRYQQLGGKVAYHGKPFAGVYQYCLRQLEMLGKEKYVLALGDGLDTDIKGAKLAGLASALITGGIHRLQLGTPWGNMPTPSALEILLAGREHLPDWVLPAFRW